MSLFFIVQLVSQYCFMFNVICVPVLIRSCRFAAAINPVMRRFSQSAPNYSPNKTMTKKKKSSLCLSFFFICPTIDYTHECPKIKEPHLPSFKKCFKQTTTYITRVGTKYTTTDPTAAASTDSRTCPSTSQKYPSFRQKELFDNHTVKMVEWLNLLFYDRLRFFFGLVFGQVVFISIVCFVSMYITNFFFSTLQCTVTRKDVTKTKKKKL